MFATISFRNNQISIVAVHCFNNCINFFAYHVSCIIFVFNICNSIQSKNIAVVISYDFNRQYDSKFSTKLSLKFFDRFFSTFALFTISNRVFFLINHSIFFRQQRRFSRITFEIFRNIFLIVHLLSLISLNVFQSHFRNI